MPISYLPVQPALEWLVKMTPEGMLRGAGQYQCFHSKHQDASASRHTTSACAGLSANHPLIAFLEINNVGKVAVGISFPATSSDVLFVHFWWTKQQK